MKRLKYFSIAFLLSSSLWWGINALDEVSKLLYFSDSDYQANISAQFEGNEIEQVNSGKQAQEFSSQKIEPESLEIGAKAAISVWMGFGSGGEQKILFSKNISQKYPIASLTKLMSAFIILKYYDASQEVQFSGKAAELSGERFKAGESFRTKNLLYSSLLESDNGATLAMAEMIGKDAFVELMNLEARDLGLKDTNFINPTGLEEIDEEGESVLINHSTVRDLADFASSLLKNNQDIWEIISKQEFNLTNSSGVFHHNVFSTNELIGDSSLSWNQYIIGGKTGWTPIAKGCLLLVLKSPDNNGYIINIIIGSDDRFGEMKKLVNWAYAAYQR